MAITLYHCKGARALRPLWTLEEMGLDYELHVLPFPPRVHQKEYLAINRLGTVPYLGDGDARMSESPAMCHYFVERYGPTPIAMAPDEADYATYLNWLYMSDATLTFPQTLVLRYTQLEPEERRVTQVVDDYRAWFLEAATEARELLCGERFTIAEICGGYALHLATSRGLDSEFRDNTRRYWARLRDLPSYRKIQDR